MTCPKKLRRRLTSATIIWLAVAGGAASAQPRLEVPPGKWTVDYGNVRCSLARRLGGPQSPVLILTSYLGRDEPEVILMRDGSEPLPALPERVDVVLSPSGEVTHGKLRSRRVQVGRVASVQDLGEGFIDRFAAASAIRLQAKGRALVELQTPSAAAAVAALRACNADLLRSWGVDPDVQLKSKAIQTSGTISDNDYPSALIAAGEKGPVVARFTVDAAGKVVNCGAVVSSGHPRLDALTCDLITRRFRYDPAIGQDGKPTASILVRTVRWLMPE
jgi:TonB family protein